MEVNSRLPLPKPKLLNNVSVDQVVGCGKMTGAATLVFMNKFPCITGAPGGLSATGRGTTTEP
jgi:hypothetical protein